MKNLWILTFSLLLNHLCFSQFPSPRIDRIGESQGLFLENEVADVKVDSEGYVWIVSFSEVIRYNGRTFQRIRTSIEDHRSFIKFQESKNKKKYVVDLRGRIFFLEADSIRAYEYNNIINDYNLIGFFPDIFIDSLNVVHVANRGGVFITINEGEVREVKEYTFGKFGRYIILRDKLPISYFIQDSEAEKFNRKIHPNYVYIINKEYVISDSVKTINKSKGYFRAITKLPNNHYLIALDNGNLLEFTESRFLGYLNFKYDVINVFLDSHNGLWISTIGNGVYYYANSIINEENKQHFFLGTTTIVSSEDKEGGIWAYSEKEGVYHISNPHLKYYNSASNSVFDNKVNHLKFGRKKLYYSKPLNYMGVLDLESNSVENVKIPLSSEQNIEYSRLTLSDIEYDRLNERLWIAQHKTIRYYKNGNWNTIDLNGLESAHIRNKILSNTDQLENVSIAGTHRWQFFIYGEDDITFISPLFPHLLSGIVSITEDSVLLNSEGGIYLWKNDSIISYKEKYPVLGNKLNDWLIWNDEIWLSSDVEGLFVLSSERLEPVAYNNEKLLNTRLVKQNNDTIWLLSNNGTFMVTKSSEGNNLYPCKALPRHYITEVESDGQTLFIGTKKHGLLRTTFKELLKQSLDPPILNIEKIMVAEWPYSIDQEHLKLSHRQNNIRLWMNGISYEDWPVNYRYKLNGLEDEWVYTIEGYIQYSNLSSGDYELEIQARKGEQKWSDSKTYFIEISPPIWKRWWFLMLLIIFLLMLIDAFYSYKLKIYNRERMLTISRLTAEQRALRARMDPHFIFNVISSLQYLVLNKMNEKASIFLEQFSVLMRSTLEQSNEEFVSIQKEVSFLKEYVEMERLRLEEKFDYEFSVDPDIMQEWEIPNFLIQPFVENAIHHGLKNKKGKGCLKLFVSSYNIDHLKVIIEDDGVGYNRTIQAKSIKKPQRSSHGIKIVKKRLGLINEIIYSEAVKIEDLNELEGKEGTRVTLIIKTKL